LLHKPTFSVLSVVGERRFTTETQRTQSLGVAGDPAYGNDSPLYGAMGFVRKSEKKSGLTRKKKS
jgi:hypothetical protein